MKITLPRVIASTGFAASLGLLTYVLADLATVKSDQLMAPQDQISSQNLTPLETDVCNQKPATLNSLFDCHQGSTLELYSNISNLPEEFIAAQLFEESTFDSYRGQGAGFGKGQLQHDPFIDTMHALLQRPDVSGVAKGLNASSISNQRAYQISVEAQFQDPSLDQYLIEIEDAMDSNFSLTEYQAKTAENISAYTSLNFDFNQLTNSGKNPWVTNRKKIRKNKQQRSEIVNEQKALNKKLDQALEFFWDDYVSFTRSEATDVKTKSGVHLWYSMDPSDLPGSYERITDILGALNMRRVYSDVWINVSIDPDSPLLKEAIIDYRIGEHAKPNKGAFAYTEKILDAYQGLLESQVDN